MMVPFGSSIGGGREEEVYEWEDRCKDNNEVLNKQLLTFNFLNQSLISEDVVQLQHRQVLINKHLETLPYFDLLYLSLSMP